MLSLKEAAAELQRVGEESDDLVRAIERRVRKANLAVTVDPESGLRLCRVGEGPHYRVTDDRNLHWFSMSRELRLMYADSLPDLVEQLQVEANKVLRQAGAGVAAARELVGALDGRG